jgi:hypothetical protein
MGTFSLKHQLNSLSHQIIDAPYTFPFLVGYDVFFNFQDNFLHKLFIWIVLWLVVSRNTVLHDRNFIFGLFIISVTRLAFTFEDADNHTYLIVWILLLLCINEFWKLNMRLIARLLLTVVFFSAAFWKASSPSFINGSMLVSMVAERPRFLPETLSFRLAKTTKADASDQVSMLKAGEVNAVEVRPSSVFLELSPLISLGIILFEFLIGFTVFFRNLDLLTHLFLLFFILFTYFLIPISGFGQTLALLGYLITSQKSVKVKLLYAIILFGLPIFGVIT